VNGKSAGAGYAGVSSDFITAKHRGGEGYITSIFPAPIRVLVNLAHSGKIKGQHVFRSGKLLGRLQGCKRRAISLRIVPPTPARSKGGQQIQVIRLDFSSA